MKRKYFKQLTQEALSNLPEEIQEKIDNVAVVIEDRADRDLEKKLISKNKKLLGLYQGVPKTAWARASFFKPPDKITIFQKPIEEISSSDKEIKENIKKTVWHEVAHHFGLNEKDVREAERKKKDS